MRSRLSAILASLSMALPLCSCSVDPAYDITEDKIDTSITLFGDGLTVPLGRTTSLKLEDVLDMDFDNSLVKLDENGYYYMQVTGSDEPRAISVPEFVIPSMSIGFNEFPEYDFPAEIVGQVAPPLFSDVFPVDQQTSISISTFAPIGIKDVISVVIDAPLAITAETSAGAVVLKKGFRIECPSFITLKSDTTGLEVEDGNVLVFTADTKFSDGSRIDLVITGIDARGLTYIETDSGRVRINLDGAVHLSGNLGVNGSDFVVIPQHVESGIALTVGDIKVKELDACYDFKAENKPLSVSLTDVPEYLLDTRLILAEPSLEARLDNNSPFRFKASADITVTYPDESTQTVKIPETTADPRSTATASLEAGTLKELTSRIPSLITLENIHAGADPLTPVHIVAGETYTLQAGYVFRAPLSFNSGTRFDFDTVLSDCDIHIGDIAMGEKEELELSFDLISTIPFDVKVSAEAVYDDGTPITGITIGPEVVIAAGRSGSESVSPVKLDLMYDGSVPDIDNIKIYLSASVPASCEGVQVRGDMYVRLDNIVARFPSGINK